MKKIVLMMLVAMVPFLTMAQKRSKKIKDVKTEIVKPPQSIDSKARLGIIPSSAQVTAEIDPKNIVFANASSLTFDKDTKTLTEVVIDKLDCDKENLFCAALMKSARKKPITFKTKDEASDAKLKSADSRFGRYVSGFLLVGKNKYKAELFFDVREGAELISCKGNIVFDGSSLGLKKSKLMITFKGEQK
jgi:hypothetical protein